LIAYFMYLPAFLSFKFGWVANNTFFCGVTNSEQILNFDFTGTLTSPHKTNITTLHTTSYISIMVLQVITM